jgi:hypothetical protein
MSLYNLKREYEERRQQLVEQLQRNPSLDPATQHQIYGAIKEIENFLKTIEYQISSEQEKNMNIELSRERPSPFVERTQKAVYHVAHGTKKVFTHHIPNAAKSVVAVPKQYFDRKKEEARLRKEIEDEIRRRKEVHQAQLSHTTEHIVLEHPHQELAMQQNVKTPAQAQTVLPGERAPLPNWNDETVRKDTPKRSKPIQVSRVKMRPSAKAKKEHQRKPHLKRDKYSRGKNRSRK